MIDLDPPDDRFDTVVDAARRCKTLLDELELTSFIKTTGSRGLHIVIPLNRSEDFDAVRDFGKDMMAQLAQRHGDTLTTEQRKDKRKGRLYLDIGRNAYAQTAVAPYAVRARDGAPVATPLDWDELGKQGLTSQTYRIDNLFKRLSQRDDPWKDMRRHATSIKAARKRLSQL